MGGSPALTKLVRRVSKITSRTKVSFYLRNLPFIQITAEYSKNPGPYYLYRLRLHRDRIDYWPVHPWGLQVYWPVPLPLPDSVFMHEFSHKPPL